jgi:hypothetical protein
MEVNGGLRTVVGAEMQRGDRVACVAQRFQFLTDHQRPSATH